MKTAIRLTLASMLCCNGLFLPSAMGREQTQPPNEPTNQSAPAASEPAQPNPPAPAQSTNPASPSPAPVEKPGPPAKSSVVKQRRKNRTVSQAPSPTHKKKTVHASPCEPTKTVVRNGGAKEGSAQLAPAITPEQAKNERANTASLLAATDANLKRVAGRQLTPEQQSIVDQIRTYMQQARAAAASADADRAQTLAYKAHLLSNELARK